jgi:hypothetical protein
VAIPGVWPLLFPRPGYKGQLNWLADVAACLGKDGVALVLAEQEVLGLQMEELQEKVAR